jgi:hypothetical protein
MVAQFPVTALQKLLTEGLDLIPQDWALTPLLGEKDPYRTAWQHESPLARNQIIAEIESGKAQGYGIRTGTISGGIVAIDFDGASAMQKALELSGGELLPDTVTFTSNRPGREQRLYTILEQYWGAIKTKKFKTGVIGDDGKPEQLELRWDGCQSVLPPSVHPNTGNYRWRKSPSEIAIAPAPMWVIEAMLIESEPQQSERYVTAYTRKARTGEKWSNEEWALSYLSALSSHRADDYDNWLAVGMALHSVSDSLLPEWENWSSQSPKYKPGDCEKKWKSFKRQGVAIGSLAHMAKQDGWRSPFEKPSGRGGDGGDGSSNATCQKPSIREAIAKAEEILKAQFSSQIDSIEASILLEELRREAGVNEYNWEQKYLKPLREKLERSLALPTTEKQPSVPTRSERRRLELIALSQERDPDKLIDDKAAFCSRYKWTRQEVDQRLRQLKTSTTTPKAKRLKGKDFLALETESISWNFPGIIPSRGVFVIAGHAGAGKTTFAYDAAGSLLLGEEFLGEKPVKTGKVLIVTGDELPCFTQDKLIDRGIPLDNEDWEILLHWDVSQWDVLEEAIADLRPALIIIDSFSSIHRDPGFDENSSQAKSTIYDLEALTNAYNCGCILIHHLSKSKDNKGVCKLRGSSAIAAAASVVCLMEQTSGGGRRLSFPKVRGAQTDQFLVELDGSTGHYEVISGGDDLGTKSLGDRILDFLQKTPHERYEQDEISEALGIPYTQKDSVYQALGRLFKRGLITKRPSRLGGKRKVYGIANPYNYSGQTHCDSSSRNVTDNSTDTPQHTPPPPRLNVSVQISESINISGLEVTDTLTDNSTDTLLTHQNDVQAVSNKKAEPVGVSAKLTDNGCQGGRVSVVSSNCHTVTDLWQDEPTTLGAIPSTTATHSRTVESGEVTIPDPWQDIPASSHQDAPEATEATPVEETYQVQFEANTEASSTNIRQQEFAVTNSQPSSVEVAAFTNAEARQLTDALTELEGGILWKLGSVSRSQLRYRITQLKEKVGDRIYQAAVLKLSQQDQKDLEGLMGS